MFLLHDLFKLLKQHEQKLHCRRRHVGGRFYARYLQRVVPAAVVAIMDGHAHNMSRILPEGRIITRPCETPLSKHSCAILQAARNRFQLLDPLDRPRMPESPRSKEECSC